MIHKPTKPLAKTNPYLQNSKQRKAQFLRAAASSCAVEGIIVTRAQLTKSAQKSPKRK